MNWELAENIRDKETVEGKIFQSLDQLEKLRRNEKVFVTQAEAWTTHTGDQSVLCIGRYFEGEKILGVFNFSEFDKTVWLNEIDGEYVDMLSGETVKQTELRVQGYGFYYFKKK